MIGGLAIGIGGLIEPRALGVGYDTIRELFAGRLVGTVVVVLLVTKALMWAIALGSGTSGGVLAPLLIMGGALGAMEAGVVHASDPGLWAMISMAAMMGGTMRSPLTAIAFLLELTGDIAILPGLLIACVAAHTVTVLVMRRSILTEKVARHGHHVMREYVVSPFARFRVDDVMHTQPNDGTVFEADRIPPVVAYADELLEEAMATMLAAGITQLPVMSRDDPACQIGVLDGTAIAAVWSELHDEEHVRDASPLSIRLRQAGRALFTRGS
jgi:CBS domain-containing protein